MPLEVIGAGFGRTGTMSLQAALDILLAPGRCYHFGEVVRHKHIELWRPALEARAPPDWELVLEREGYVATMDHPCADFYEDLMRRYPAAKVVLSEHPGGPERWYDSKLALELVREAVAKWPVKPLAAVVLPVLSRLLFHTKMTYSFSEMIRFVDSVEFNVWGERTVRDRSHALETYRAWNSKVKATVPSERLLVYSVKQGWEPLCKFLGKPVPDAPFPMEDSHSTKHIKIVMFCLTAGLWALYAGTITVGVLAGTRAYQRSRH